ncbi:MAG: superoxide dismutase [Proteobacteria bacterium]|nr:superoxide dismutase [Pseudomonadota bacterium]
MAITLPELPYPKNALEPYISERTLEFHYGKHHSAYVTKLDGLISGTDLESENLETIVKKSAGDASRVLIFNNAAQVWNHSFYWQCMKAGGGGAPSGELNEKIESDLGSLINFIEEFKTAAATQFGSGWAWLVLDEGRLKVTKTPNADTPLAYGQKALLTIDVWEHAYYLDYQNRRPDYINTFLEKLVNWDFVAANLSGSMSAAVAM